MGIRKEGELVISHALDALPRAEQKGAIAETDQWLTPSGRGAASKCSTPGVEGRAGRRKEEGKQRRKS